jgi:CHAT domain-containing protein
MAAGEQASAASREMFLQLLAPVSEITRYKQIVIVRDGPLHFVPFEALESADGQALVDSVAVTYAPSASALVALMNKKHHLQSARVLAVGGVPYSESGPNQSAFLRGFSNRTFANLPGSVDEVKTAVAVAPDGQRRLLLGREATESAVKAHLPRFGYLHFAVHGVSDKINSERAALILLSDERAGEDGILQSSEIMHLKLTADVVTLSACETSVGTIHGHEGIENLSRAFLIAGARAVVSTLWQVDDQSSAYLMKRFYLHLAAKSPPTFALAEAKRDLRRAFGARATPYQWAGFVLEGGL